MTDGVGERDGDDLIAPHRDGLAELPSMASFVASTPNRVARIRSTGTGRATTLDVPEDGGTHLVAGHPLDFARDRERDAAQALPAGHRVLRW